MNEILRQEIHDYLGEARLKALADDLTANSAYAMALYLWEQSLRQTLLKPLMLTEVIVRNSLDKALMEWWSASGHEGAWTAGGAESTELTPFLSVEKWAKRARADFENKERIPSHDDLIAHASFGTWRNMIGNPLAVIQARSENANEKQARSWEGMRLQDARCAELWRVATKDAFKCIPATKSERGKLSPRAYIGSRLSRLSALRNRVCHCDSLLRVNVERRYADMLDIVNAVSPRVGKWFDGLCREEITNVIQEKPKRSVDESSIEAKSK